MTIPRPHALNYRSCSRKLKQEPSTPSSPDTPPNQLQEAVGGIHRVFDNLLDIARGNDPSANGYDMLRATQDPLRQRIRQSHPEPAADADPRNQRNPVITRITVQTSPRPRPPRPPTGPPPSSSRSSTILSALHRHRQIRGERIEAQRSRREPVLSEAQRSRRAPIRLDEPGHIPAAPGYVPDLVREAQYYVLEITNYGAELAKILAYIHEPDPEDTTIRACHRITAGLMIVDRVLGAAADLETPLDHWHDPSLEPNWGYKHPAEIDSSVPLEEIIEADRFARKRIEGMRREREEFEEEYGDREDTGPCEDCYDDDLCEYHMMAEELSKSEEEVLTTARGMRNLEIFRDRLYFDENGLLRLHPPPPIDDS